ncbi:MAG: hypothetical protein K9J25_01260 [Bacteroidales bacterium]|nr:hypothetical protein [Bacteroidales bacterium]
MKRISYILITIISLSQVILFNACKKPERILKVNTITVSSEDISYNQVEIKGEIIDMGEGAVTNHGVLLREANGTGADFTNHSLGAKYSRGVFSIFIDNPEPNTKYEYKAFAISGGSEFYGEQKSFTSLDISVPALETYEATDITQTKVRAGARISDEGGLDIIDFGFCWNKSGTPTLNDSVITNDDPWDSMEFTNSEYIMEVNNLEPGTEYYLRAYATNLHGTGFGNTIIFKTFDINTTGTFTDTRDGNTYKWVEIGDQVWMAENLAYLPKIYSPDTAGGYFTLYYVYGYEGNNISEAKASDNYNTYGVLYNWNAALNGSQSNDDNPGSLQGICPDGWHLPSDNEWKELELYLGMTTEEVAASSGRGDKGGTLKEGYYEHWLIPNTGATNITGFTALPGGAMIDNNGGSFENLGQWGTWWTSTEAIDSDAWNRSLNYADNKIHYNGDFKSNAYSVRCIQGQGASLPVVTTTDATDLVNNSATLGGVITDDGNSVEGEAGIYYSTTEDPVSDGTKVNITGSSSEQSFQETISPLTENQTYYYLAYARNIAGTSYGEMKSFVIIPEEAPSVNTVSVSSVTSTSADCTGNVTYNGSSEANDRGFCYNTTGNPTITDNTVQNNVNGTGEFTETLSGLTPGTTYYVKAYAANNEGTGYGEQLEFTTLDLP